MDFESINRGSSPRVETRKKHIRSMHSESESPLPNFDMDKWYDIMTKDHHTEYS